MDSAETSSSSSAIVPAQQQSIPGKIPWPEAPSIIQNFSLPSSIMYYMAKNPSSPEVYNKMIKSCKYFFEKNPILVVANMSGDGELKICSNAFADCNGRCCVKIGNKNISSKFWLTNFLNLCCVGPEHLTSLLLPQIYRCDVGEILMANKHVMYDDFKFLAASVIEFFSDDVKMFYNDGKAVALENIIEAVPNIKTFRYIFSGPSAIINASTMRNITKLMNPEQLEFFCLEDIPSEVLSVEDVSAFIKSYKDTKIILEFDNISEEYKALLDGLVDTVIASEVTKCLFWYYGQDEEKFEIMNERCCYFQR